MKRGEETEATRGGRVCASVHVDVSGTPLRKPLRLSERLPKKEKHAVA
jgi:hypothetical protein